MSYSIKTEFGFIEYARFCGGVCEAFAYGTRTYFTATQARAIVRALRAAGVRYCNPSVKLAPLPMGRIICQNTFASNLS